ncbi:MAG: CerR family C-terminal domain-containing protein [Desulfobacterales bacterium]|jgi:AcrR family transcriptional regulator|nr:CerR family C-terminal domain-containing protein [Desulfobacterales bacterium]
MTKREDGKETRRRLLNAACEVFAQKGYRDAMVAEICQRAGANVAAVNYYFKDKKNLYRSVWQHALENFEELAFAEIADYSPQDRLRAYIQTLVQNFTARGDMGRFGRLYLMEMVNPTGLIQNAWHDTIEPIRRKLHQTIRDIIGPEAEEISIRFCELSIVNQCRMFVTIKHSDLEYMIGKPLSPELIKQLAAHIADFSLAGISAIGRNLGGLNTQKT